MPLTETISAGTDGVFPIVSCDLPRISRLVLLKVLKAVNVLLDNVNLSALKSRASVSGLPSHDGSRSSPGRFALLSSFGETGVSGGAGRLSFRRLTVPRRALSRVPAGGDDGFTPTDF